MLGSPPHTWGILAMKEHTKQLVRITPTYMGNTELEAKILVFMQDHPHIHGEYSGS